MIDKLRTMKEVTLAAQLKRRQDPSTEAGSEDEGVEPVPTVAVVGEGASKRRGPSVGGGENQQRKKTGKEEGWSLTGVYGGGKAAEMARDIA